MLNANSLCGQRVKLMIGNDPHPTHQLGRTTFVVSCTGRRDLPSAHQTQVTVGGLTLHASAQHHPSATSIAPETKKAERLFDVPPGGPPRVTVACATKIIDVSCCTDCSAHCESGKYNPAP